MTTEAKAQTQLSDSPVAITAARVRLPLLGLLAAGFISSTGSNFTAVVIPWFVLVTTGSAAKTGLTLAMYSLPMLVAGIFGSALVDRLGFVRSSILSDIGAGLLVAAIPLLYHTVGLPLWTLLLLVFSRGLLVNPGGTARMSLVPDLARLAGMPLERANSLTSAAQRLALLFGPPLAGVLIAVLGASNVLWLDALSFWVSAAIFGVAVAPRAARDAMGTAPRPRRVTRTCRRRSPGCASCAGTGCCSGWSARWRWPA